MNVTCSYYDELSSVSISSVLFQETFHTGNLFTALLALSAGEAR